MYRFMHNCLSMVSALKYIYHCSWQNTTVTTHHFCLVSFLLVGTRFDLHTGSGKHISSLLRQNSDGHWSCTDWLGDVQRGNACQADNSATMARCDYIVVTGADWNGILWRDIFSQCVVWLGACYIAVLCALQVINLMDFCPMVLGI